MATAKRRPLGLMLAILIAAPFGFSAAPRPPGKPLRSWERAAYQPGGGTPLLLYVVYGNLPAASQVDGGHYRTAGGGAFAANLYGQGVHPEVCAQWLQGPLGALLRQSPPTLMKTAAAASGCMVIRGEPADPPTLDYLRDAVGFVTYLTDNGAVAILDPQMLRLWSPADWRKELFDPDGPVPHRHVVILTSDEDRPGLLWFHTRGMRKFGRPDLSLHGVADSQRAAVVDLFNRFIELLAMGGIVADGQEIRIPALPPGMTCHLRGAVDDPDFNNVHLEIEAPATLRR
jgi:hypothetical protein